MNKKKLNLNLKSGVALCCAATFGKIIDVITRYYTGEIVDKGIDRGNIFLPMIAIFIICCTTILMNYITPYVNSKFELSFTGQLFTKIENALLFSDQKDIDQKNIGEISTGFTYDVNGLLQFARRGLTILVPDIITFVICAALLIMMSLSLGIVALFSGIVSVYLMTRLSKSMVKQMNEYQEKLKEINRLTSDGLFNDEMIKVNMMCEDLIENYDEELKALHDIKRKIALRQAMLSAPSMILSFLTLVSIAFYGGYLVMLNKLSLGNVFSAIVISDYIVSPIMRFENSLVQYRRAAVNKKNLYSLVSMDQENEIIENVLPAREFEMKSLEFDYCDGSRVFENINLKFKKGKINYLLGRNGIGKSTVIKIITGVYRTETGMISLPVDSNLVCDIRREISVLCQEPLLFPDTIRNNILAGATKNEAEMHQLSKEMGIDNEIQGMEHGYDTVLQENGEPLSGGQKKRIAFMRSILCDCNVYFFDEPTANIDDENAGRMMKYIEKLASDHVVVVITHDQNMMKQYPGFIHNLEEGK